MKLCLDANQCPTHGKVINVKLVDFLMIIFNFWFLLDHLYFLLSFRCLYRRFLLFISVIEISCLSLGLGVLILFYWIKEICMFSPLFDFSWKTYKSPKFSNVLLMQLWALTFRFHQTTFLILSAFFLKKLLNKILHVRIKWIGFFC